MPVAAVLLWQLAQLVSVAAWAKVAPDQLVVLLWQVEQSAVVATWPVPLACAPDVPWLVYEPLWQEPQAMAVTAA
jgi:hypothetical protein